MCLGGLLADVSIFIYHNLEAKAYDSPSIGNGPGEDVDHACSRR